ncbi:MAG TPA: hypothetical protein VEW46_13030, partial [Pyrinomonadaceae bacterium]|nr:hypothetical protein [Pyrinomonadaceae bacterium]
RSCDGLREEVEVPHEGLALLGVRRLVGALARCDLSQPWQAQVNVEIRVGFCARSRRQAAAGESADTARTPRWAL